jgi:dTDP-4-amino-4,6-dideoxygalactose transaminase
MTISIPFNRPTHVDRESHYLADVLSSGHWSGDGAYTRRCHEQLEARLGVPKALLTTSCTHALEMAALLLDLQAGDEVIVPTFTFVSMVNAFVLRGARPVFADIRADTFNLDPQQLDALITPRTKAIIIVHYGGVACDMDRIGAIAARHGVPLVEDNAHGLFGGYRGRPLGTFGRLATLSFHETKNITCGEGGALLVNDPALLPRAEILREKGTNRSQFFRGQVDKYRWIDVGSSYLPSDLLAAILLAQLEAADGVQASRRRIWERYAALLAEWAAARDVRLPIVPPECEPAYHMFPLLMPNESSRDALIAHLRAQGMLAVFHYLPLHASPMGGRFGGRTGQCPVAEDVSRRLLRLPFFTNMTTDEQDRVIDAVTQFIPLASEQALARRR